MHPVWSSERSAWCGYQGSPCIWLSQGNRSAAKPLVELREKVHGVSTRAVAGKISSCSEMTISLIAGKVGREWKAARSAAGIAAGNTLRKSAREASEFAPTLGVMGLG